MSDDFPELTAEQLSRGMMKSQRKRIMSGKLKKGDVAALRRFVGATQVEFAEALGISVHTLRNWEQDRRFPEGPALALLRVVARYPKIVRQNLDSSAA